MKKLLIIGIFVSIVCLPLVVEATTDTQALIESLRQQIETLRVQILELQGQLATFQEVKKETKDITKDIKSTLKIARQLDFGANGEDVALLQEILATDPSIYPEGFVTGYFGPLTYNAVKNFQKKMGVEQVGRVGPKTMSKINELLDEGAGSSGKVPPGLLIAPGIEKKIGYSPEVPSDQKLPPGIAKKLDHVTSTPDTIQ